MIRVPMIASVAAMLLLSGCGGKANDKAELDKIDAKLGGKAGLIQRLPSRLKSRSWLTRT